MIPPDPLEEARAALEDAQTALLNAAEKLDLAMPAQTKRERWQRGNRTQVTVSLAPELLEQLDEIARRKHLNRSSLLTVWINEALAREAA